MLNILNTVARNFYHLLCEISNALFKIKAKMSPCGDGISVEWLMTGCQPVIKVPVKLFSKVGARIEHLHSRNDVHVFVIIIQKKGTNAN